MELGEHERDRHHWCFGRWQLGLRIILISQQIGRDNRHSLAGWLAYHQLIAHHLLACILRAEHEWPSKDSNLYTGRRVHPCNVSECLRVADRELSRGERRTEQPSAARRQTLARRRVELQNRATEGAAGHELLKVLVVAEGVLKGRAADQLIQARRRRERHKVLGGTRRPRRREALVLEARDGRRIALGEELPSIDQSIDRSSESTNESTNE